MDLLEICRLCAERHEAKLNMFQSTLVSKNKEKELSEIYSYVTNLKINHEDGLSTFICNECSVRMGDAYEFKCRAEDSYKKMLELLHDKAKADNIKAAVMNANDEGKSNIILESQEVEESSPLKDVKNTHADDASDDVVSIIDIEEFDMEQSHDENSSEDDKEECAVKYLTGLRKTPKINAKIANQLRSTNGMKRIEKTSRHTCQVCGRVFPRKSNLIDHLRLHAKVKLFQCNQCEKSFVQVANYRTHMRTHTQERPYQCYLCSKAYSQSSTLKIHIRSHTDERNYQCTECNKAFTNASDLNKHKRVHDPNKQFKCEICFRLFAQKVNMLNHQRRMHKDDM